MSLRVHFTGAFTDGPPGLGKLGPLGKAKKESAFQRIYRRLIGIGKICENGDWLGLGHLRDEAYTRSGYPPRAFGAFLSDLDDRDGRDGGDCVAFASMDSLSDGDSQGYFTRYDARLEDLHCAVLFTLLPTPRLLVLGIGDRKHVSNLLVSFRSAEAARKAIAEARGRA